MTFGSLFSGIGGIDLGLERAGMRCLWQSEIDTYASRVLKKHWPHVPNLGDITRIDWSTVERPDLIAGGFPCQDISFAGKGVGLAGARSGLWYEFARCIRELGPRYVLVENVAALLVRGLDAVLGTLASLGYDAEWHVIPAAAVGAPHLRERVFLLAYPVRLGLEAEPRQVVLCQSPARNGHARHVGPMGSAAVWSAPRPIGARPVGVGDRVPSELDRIRGLGNAVVPQVAEWIGRMILEAPA